ncbi:hypothetical protein KI387_028128, partial [Taxus chinensis]
MDSNMDAEKKKEDNNRIVSFHKLFFKADCLDIMLMSLGTIGAVGNGMALPLMTILFGNTINAFGNHKSNVQIVLHEVSK